MQRKSRTSVAEFGSLIKWNEFYISPLLYLLWIYTNATWKNGYVTPAMYIAGVNIDWWNIHRLMNDSDSSLVWHAADLSSRLWVHSDGRRGCGIFVISIRSIQGLLSLVEYLWFIFKSIQGHSSWVEYLWFLLNLFGTCWAKWYTLALLHLYLHWSRFVTRDKNVRVYNTARFLEEIIPQAHNAWLYLNHMMVA